MKLFNKISLSGSIFPDLSAIILYPFLLFETLLGPQPLQVAQSIRGSISILT